jgi:hypothetical protein
MQFKDPLSDFHRSDTAKNPILFPPQWLSSRQTPTIPHIVGVIVISLSSAYALFEAAWLLIKAFIETVR